MLVKVRHGYTFNLELKEKKSRSDGVYPEDSVLEVTEEEYGKASHILEKIIPKNQAERDFYDRKLQEIKDGNHATTVNKIKVKIRGGYTYPDSITGKDSPSGTIISLTEQEYMERYWVFDRVDPPSEKEKEEEEEMGEGVGLILVVPKESIVPVVKRVPPIEEVITITLEKSSKVQGEDKTEKVKEGKVNEGEEKEKEEKSGAEEGVEKTKEGEVEDKLMDTKKHRAILRQPGRSGLKRRSKT